MNEAGNKQRPVFYPPIGKLFWCFICQQSDTNPQTCLCDAACVCVRVCVCVCTCRCQKNSRFHSPLPTVYLNCYPAYDEDAKQTLSKSFALLRMQTYLPDQTGDLPRRTLNRGSGCTRLIQKQNENKTKHFLHSFSVIHVQKSHWCLSKTKL